MKTLAIIGGGAAGLACAVAAGEQARALRAGFSCGEASRGEGVTHDVCASRGEVFSRGEGALHGEGFSRGVKFPRGEGASRDVGAARGEDVRVVVFEADERVGRSILATGNGRCNFSNAHIDASLYRNATFVGDVLMQFEARAAQAAGAAEDLPAFALAHAAQVTDAPVPTAQVGAGLVPATQVESEFVSATQAESELVSATQAEGVLVSATQAEGVLVSATQAEGVPVSATRAEGVLVPATQAEGMLVPATQMGNALMLTAQAEGVFASSAQVANVLSYANGVQEFFARHGLMWREEGEGRLYPLANKASVVLDVLRAAARAAGVEERTCARVERVEPPRAAGKRFTLRMADGAFERADAVVVACGGRVARSLLPEGVSFVSQRPVLGPLATDARFVRQLDNIRAKGVVELRRGGRVVARERGEVMFRKYGVSGVCVFNLSRLACPGDELAIDFLTQVPKEGLLDLLRARAERLGQANDEAVTWEDVLRGMVLPQVSHVLLASCGISEEDEFRVDAVPAVARVLKGFAVKVEGIGDARQCQVTRGGVDVAQLNVRTCELVAVPGLYVVGEALDVDAPCGGYNLHWAWASGLLAGWSAGTALAQGHAGTALAQAALAQAHTGAASRDERDAATRASHNAARRTSGNARRGQGRRS